MRCLPSTAWMCRRPNVSSVRCWKAAPRRGASVSYISSVKKKDSNELSFTVTKGFDLLLSRYQKLFAQRIAGNRGDRLQFYCTPFSDLNMLLNLLSMLDCLSFSVEGGGTPCVHVRFDNPELLQQLADSDEYHNLILDTNERIFEEQIELFSFFFGTDTLTDSQRWDFVEEYFTGTTVEELKKKYGGSRPYEFGACAVATASERPAVRLHSAGI